ncbi:hypothetical protein HK097_001961 [Rhizophlyctis rosea]|uniref:G-protein coupled receptors family 3 profile domain-containing protein n=1 Tax=Rhizophlyctis rosea TaxID=64517 RepID=A0AAD5S4X6_9FUNG|nr:hypothetical protein HK097_001961 [Rhizophlyctis rosea]
MRLAASLTATLLSVLFIRETAAQYYEWPLEWPWVKATMYGADGAVWDTLKYTKIANRDAEYLKTEMAEESPDVHLTDTMSGCGYWYWNKNRKDDKDAFSFVVEPPDADPNKLVTIMAPSSLWGAAALTTFVQLAIRQPRSNGMRFRYIFGSWTDVGSVPLCDTSSKWYKERPDDRGYWCPDMIILGTTDVLTRVNRDEVIPLDTYFDQYSQTEGTIFYQTFLQSYFYTFNINGKWMGVPCATDTRVTYFNKRVLLAAGLKLPPPHEDWGAPYTKTWTWEKFAEYAKVIREYHIANGHPEYYGFEWRAGNNEELWNFVNVGRNARVQFLGADDRCNLTAPAFQDAIRKSFYKMFVEDKSANPNWFDQNPDTLAKLEAYKNNQTLGNQQTTAGDLGLYYADSIFAREIQGLTLEVPSWFWYNYWKVPEALIWDPQRNLRDGDIAMAYYPGITSFLGGAGIHIVNGSKNHDLSWTIISMMLDPNLPHSARVGGNPPPSEIAWANPPWNAAHIDTARRQLRASLPPEYPRPPFAQYGRFQDERPFRSMLLEMVYKGLSVEQATERACGTINDIFLRQCTAERGDLATQVTECQPKNRKKRVSWEWVGVETTCRPANLSDVPEPTETNCRYVPYSNSMGSGLVFLSAFGILLSLVFAVLVWIKREEPSIKRSSVTFTEIMLVGAILIHASVVLWIGVPTDDSCLGRTWLLVLGFALLFGSLAVKVLRIFIIFKGAKNSTKRAVTDLRLVLYLAGIVLVEVALLIWLSARDGPRAAVVYDKVVSGFTIANVPQEQCYGGRPGANWVLIILNCLLLLSSLFICFKVSDAPSAYNENKFIGASAMMLGFVGVVILPLMLIFDDPYLQTLLYGLGANFAVMFSVLIFVVPKIFPSLAGEGHLSGVRSQLSDSDNGISGVKNIGSSKLGTMTSPTTMRKTKKGDDSASGLDVMKSSDMKLVSQARLP